MSETGGPAQVLFMISISNAGLCCLLYPGRATRLVAEADWDSAEALELAGLRPASRCVSLSRRVCRERGVANHARR